MAANRVGKTESGAYETTCHLTGDYPAWWKGHRFTEPIEAWACGTTHETTRDIVQAKLMGPVDDIGTGMLPGDLIVHSTPRRGGLNGSLETVWIKHVSGRYSKLGFKSYVQGRKAFEGTAKHWLWFDEEPPLDIYMEGLFRTVTTQGKALTTFTPLQGMSEVVMSFLEPETVEAAQFKGYVQAGWADVPHIVETEKAALLASTPLYQQKARMFGEPSLGAGAIYPIAETEITCAPFPIPDSWPRAYALDVGWKRTAAIWGAKDPGSGVLYLYSAHYQGQGEPASHALAIKGRGDWIKGVIDPAARGRTPIDGQRLIEVYRELGLLLTPAVNAVEAGLTEVWQQLLSGRLKVFASLGDWLAEFRKYHRDEHGKIVKQNDHLMDATRYLVMSGDEQMSVKTPPEEERTFDFENTAENPLGWMS